MAFSFTTALESQQKSLEDMLAQRELENSVLFRVAQEQERRRATQVDDEFKRRQHEENLAQRKLAQQALDDQRKAAAEKAKADADARNQQVADKQAELARLEALSKDPTQPEHVRQAALYKFHGINPVGDVQTGRDRIAEGNARSQAALNNAIALMLRRDALGDENRREVEQTKALQLPPEAQQYINSLPQKIDPETGQPYTYERAKAELQRNLARMATGNPHLSAQKVFSALDQAFTKPNEDRIIVNFVARTPQEKAAVDQLKAGGYDITADNVAKIIAAQAAATKK